MSRSWRSGNIGLPIYMDYQATTPVDPRIISAMMPWLTEKFGNPHSVSHSYGWEAEDAVNRARGHVADLIGASGEEITFTSGATEANNLVFQGLARAYGLRKRGIVTTVTEHPCVVESARSLEEEGYSVTWLDVGPDGLLDIAELKRAITEDTLLVSVMAVQNEIGVIQPLAEIGAACREKGAFFHTDAAQALGKIPLDVAVMKIDLLTFSGHKIYAPKGIGGLYKRRRGRIRLAPLFHGGGQEEGIRSGTQAPALCVAMGEAARVSAAELAPTLVRLKALQTGFLDAVTGELDGIIVNGDLEMRYPGNLNLSFEGVDPDALIPSLRDIAVSSGSACASGSTEPSPVLDALGRSEELSRASIRFGFGRFTTDREMAHAARHVIDAVRELRKRA